MHINRQAISTILKEAGISETAVCENGQTTVEYLEGAIMGALDECEEAEEPEPTKYGVTWATKEESIAQTGYVFDNTEDAKAALLKGPFKQDTQVDSMTSTKYVPGTPVFGRIECENDEHGEWEVPQENLKQE